MHMWQRLQVVTQIMFAPSFLRTALVWVPGHGVRLLVAKEMCRVDVHMALHIGLHPVFQLSLPFWLTLRHGGNCLEPYEGGQHLKERG